MKVFICYPSEHEDQAREVRSFVRSVGIDCWFDKDSLVAGEDWDRVRRDALSNANVVVVLCSTATTGRNGIYQRELNEALRNADDRRLGSVYIIPLRVTDVGLPQELARLQYVDLFGPTWKQKLAAGLAKAVAEAREDIPAPLHVAAAQPDEGGLIPRFLSEERPEGNLDVSWINYAFDGDYWDFVNGVIRAKALGGMFEARRQLAEWWQPTGSSWELHISEFHRKGQLVSLTIGSSSYFSHAAHPNHSLTTLNFLGEEAGLVGARDVFNSDNQALGFLTEYVNLDLKRQYVQTAETIDLSYYAETYGWELYEHFNFNEQGMQINFSAASGLPHVLGFHEVYVPWQQVEQFLAPVARRILLGA